VHADPILSNAWHAPGALRANARTSMLQHMQLCMQVPQPTQRLANTFGRQFNQAGGSIISDAQPVRSVASLAGATVSLGCPGVACFFGWLPGGAEVYWLATHDSVR
jgi:hypothetical protein